MPYYALVLAGQVVNEKFLPEAPPELPANLLPIEIEEEARKTGQATGDVSYRIEAKRVVKVIRAGAIDYQAARIAKQREISQYERRLLAQGFAYNGRVFDLQDEDMVRVAAMAVRAGLDLFIQLVGSLDGIEGFSIPTPLLALQAVVPEWDSEREKFIDRDGVPYGFESSADAYLFALTGYALVARVTFTGKAHRDAVAALPDDIEQIDGYDYSGGWT